MQATTSGPAPGDGLAPMSQTITVSISGQIWEQ